jgi:hypothetical protein
MAIDKLYEEIKRLPLKQKKELFKRLGLEPKKTRALDELIGIADGPKDKGSHTYKEDLYGGPKPL